MISYIKLSTNEYPIHEGDIRLLHPEIGETFVCPSDYAIVEKATPPVISEELGKPVSETVVELAPIQINGVWTQQWTTRALTSEETQILTEMLKPKNVANLTASGSAPNVIG